MIRRLRAWLGRRRKIAQVRESSPVSPLAFNWTEIPDPDSIRVARSMPADMVCVHGVAIDVHCCGCHDGFIFDNYHDCKATLAARLAFDLDQQ